MLSLAKVISAESAAHYYHQADDYYSEYGHAPSAWFGAGARTLELSGEVKTEAFARLLEGRMPDGSTLHRGGAESRRAATDMTFSAPKSVSLQALIGDDRRLLAAHDIAVERVLGHVEAKLAAYRETAVGKTESKQSNNILVAQYPHNLSRAQEPQLHVHAILLNMTQRPDGAWRALDTPPLYHQKMLLGAMYRAELALEVQKLGYAVRLTHSDGRFELAHISDTQVKAFSSRSQAIEANLQAYGKDRANASGVEREIAARNTRERKTAAEWAKLRAQWEDKSRELGIDYSARASTVMDAAERERRLESAVTFAIEHLTERHSIVKREALVECALGRATGVAGMAAIERALMQRVAAGELMEAEGRYAAAWAQQCERDILAIEARGRQALAPLIAGDWRSGLAVHGLNPDQREALRLVLTTRHQVVGINGGAGTGKTHLLAQVRNAAAMQKWRSVGLAPTANAARELNKTGIRAQTIAAFLAHEGAGLGERSMVVLDEAGMVAAKDMRDVLQAVEKAGARIVLVGDVNQLKAVQAGIPFQQLQEAGMTTARMAKIERQKHNRELKTAVEHAARGEMLASLQVLAPHIVEIDYAGERYARMAADYTKLTPQQREQTLLVAGTHFAREAINAFVRGELGLAGQGVSVRILQSRDFTEAQRKSSLSYQLGDIVQVQRHYPSLSMWRGELATVVSTACGLVGLQRESGQVVTWRPRQMSDVAAYQLAEREITVGDRIRVSANDHARDLINGDIARVSAIDVTRNELTLIKAEGGQAVTLPLDRPLHVEHGYCVTVHSAQGKTCDRALIDADASSAMANESLFYVAISRAKSEVRLYTDDLALLPERMSRSENREAALALDPASLENKPERTRQAELSFSI